LPDELNLDETEDKNIASSDDLLEGNDSNRKCEVNLENSNQKKRKLEF
jgi:hypothetical protein